jgi:hypothetical protein
MNYGAANTTAQNTLSAANYLANTQIGAQQAQAQGDINAANQWNGMLGQIGTTANGLAVGGMGTPGSPSSGWSFSNIPYSFGMGGW